MRAVEAHRAVEEGGEEGVLPPHASAALATAIDPESREGAALAAPTADAVTDGRESMPTRAEDEKKSGGLLKGIFGGGSK